MFGETVASSLTGSKSPVTKKDAGVGGKSDAQPGIVTIIDMLKVGEGQVQSKPSLHSGPARLGFSWNALFLFGSFRQRISFDS